MKKFTKIGLLNLTLLLVPSLACAMRERPMSELMATSSQAESAQTDTSKPRRLGGMSYSNQTANLQVDSAVSAQAPDLQSTIQLFSFNDNPMVGYILLPNNQKINYTRSNKPAQDPDYATLGELNNYYVILATGDLSTLINSAQTSTQAQSTSSQTPARGPLVGGMSYSNRTTYLQVDPSVALKAPNLKNKIQVFSFNDNPMYGYVLADGQKINYQRAKDPAQGSGSATLGILDNYYVIISSEDLSKLIRIANPIAGE